MIPSRALRAMAVRSALPALVTASTAGGTSLCRSPRCAAATFAGPVLTQRRTQYMPVAGKRDQEAFLSQFDPMDVLGVEEGCMVEDIDAAFERLKSKYAANGATPDAKMLERVFQAHEILKDPGSPYYVRAHSSQTDRQRLQFQLLPKNKRRAIEFQVGILLCVLFMALFMLVKLCLAPMKKSLRAATR